jgi:creatinine deaminase
MLPPMDLAALLTIALEEAGTGAAEGGVPIGAALYRPDGTLLGRGRNRRVQEDDPSAHAETDAFRRAGRQRSYRDTIMVTTLAPCWYCSGLIRQFHIPTVVIGESRTFAGGKAWLAELGVSIHDLDDNRCADLMTRFVTDHPDIWFEDIGQDVDRP